MLFKALEKVKNNKSVEIDYQISKRIEEIISMPGAIGRISVGVMVPENVGLDKLNNLKSIISMAVGLDASRGDGVAIYPMKMDVFEKVKINAIAISTAPIVEQPYESQREETITVDSIGENIISYKQLIYVAAGFIFLSLMLILKGLLSLKSARNNKQQELSIQEKERLLSDLKSWINEGAA